MKLLARREAETPTDEDRVFAAARLGDPRAFATLHRRFAPIVHGIALARVGPAEAEDVVQEAFLAIHRGLAGVRDPAALPGWIRSVAANAATDRLRRRLRRPRTEPLPDEVPAPRDAREDGTALHDLRARVLARIQGLPEPYREALIWRLVEGLDGPEIAARTGHTPTSIRVHLHRGMALLRPLLAEDGLR